MGKYVKQTNVIIVIFALPIYIMIYISLDGFNNSILSGMKFAFCWLGIMQLILHSVQWKKITQSWFSKQILFIMFCFLFNYGQCFMWALGIHAEREIGSTLLYNIFIISDLILCKTQLITLFTLLMLNTGLLLLYNRKQKEVFLLSRVNNQSNQTTFLHANLIISFVIIPIAFYCTIRNYIIANRYGYSSLYYGNHAYATSTVLVLISMMFFPCIMGILIGNVENHKGIKRYAYGSLILVSLISFASGDRGFVYQLMILLFWHMEKRIEKRVNKGKLIVICVMGYVTLAFLVAVTKVRSSQFAYSDLFEALYSIDSPISSALFEMGGSMAPLVSLVSAGTNIYPYGNTLLLALLGMISERMITFFGIPYVSLSNWFSFSYLGLKYGVGFSVIAELYLNFGYIFGPLFALALGAVFGKLFNVRSKNAFSELFSVASLSALVYIARNTLQNGTKNFFYEVIVYIFIVWLLESAFRWKRTAIND